MVDISYRGPTYKLSLFGRSTADYELADYVKNVVCYNQGELIQYSFLAAEFHKSMKIAHSEGEVGTARECQIALIDFLNRNLERITKENFKFFQAHFKRRAKQAPRICLKGTYEIGNQDSIVSLFRDTHVNYDSNCKIGANTGFDKIHHTGRPYLCNNIPGRVRVGEYANPRLNSSAAKLYSSPGWIKRKLGLDKGPDEEWQKCWTGAHGHVTPDACYKSTLITPLTLWNNSLDDYYKELINLPTVDRTIFGFLCIDHVNQEYFIEDIDVPVGYIFADILSLYLVSRLVYTEISQTFNAVANTATDGN